MNRKFNICTGLKYIFAACLLSCALVSGAHASVSSIIIDAETGDVLSSSNADSLRYPASLTKLMTLYITFNALDKGLIKFEDKLPVSRNAANRSPSKLGLKKGETITVRDAVLALIVKSANDCATVLAEGLGYSEENFAKTMTEVAQELGMKNTTFKNASGLPNRAQKTTARDMALLGAAMYHHFPEYYKLFATKKFTYNGRTYYTHNHLLKSFEGADGMKTGFTNAAGYNIVTSAERDGHRVIAVTMGHNTIRQRDTKVASLMKKGLQKLAMSDHIEAPNLYANADTHTYGEPSLIEAATVADETPASDVWAVQIGAFSNYAKARNYAISVKKQLKMAGAEIDIEPAQKGSAVIYRSKLVGFEKNEADKTCNSLKKSNKSCIVIASSENQQLVMAKNN
jgi:serine-type D-ala-D-ala carboxypeptidase